MKKYVHLIDGKVATIIPSEDDRFPRVPLSQRYAPEFVAGLIVVPDDADVRPGMVYRDGAFVEPTTTAPMPPSDIEGLRAYKLASLNAACKTAIEAGVDFGGEHYSLTTDDQINLMALSAAAMQDGLPKPYHADGKACRMYPAADIMALAGTATAHITYHTTYTNLLRQYVRSLTDADAIDAVSYGMDLPEEYAAIMAEILGGDA